MDNILKMRNIVAILTIILIASFELLSSYTYGSLVMILLIVCIFAVINGFQKKRIPIKITNLHMYIFLFCIWGYMTSFWAINPKSARTISTTILQMLVMSIAIYSCFFKTVSNSCLLKWVMYANIIVVMAAFIYYGPDQLLTVLQNSERMSSEFLNSNTLGLMGSFAIIIAIYFFRKKEIKFVVVLIIPCIVIVASSGSRKALLALVIGIILQLLIDEDAKNVQAKVMKILLVVLVGLIILYLINSIQIFSITNERFQKFINLFTGEGNVDRSTLIRYKMIEIGMEQFKETPITGIGMNNARFIAAKYFGFEYYLHNNYVELLVDSGLIGTVIYYAMYIYLLINLLKYRRVAGKCYSLVFTMVVIQLLMDMAMVSYYSKDTYMNLTIYYLYLNRLKIEVKQTLDGELM